MLTMNTRANPYQTNRDLNISNVADEEAALWRRQRTRTVQRQRTSTVHVRAHHPVRGISCLGKSQSVTTADWLQAIGSIIWRFYSFLGALAQLRNAPISVVKPVRPSVTMSVCRHVSARLQLDRFWCNVILWSSVTICRGTTNLVQIGNFTWKPKYLWMLPVT